MSINGPGTTINYDLLLKFSVLVALSKVAALKSLVVVELYIGPNDDKFLVLSTGKH